MSSEYDVVVVGAGLAGMTAALTTTTSYSLLMGPSYPRFKYTDPGRARPADGASDDLTRRDGVVQAILV